MKINKATIVAYMKDTEVKIQLMKNDIASYEYRIKQDRREIATLEYIIEQYKKSLQILDEQEEVKYEQENNGESS